MNCTHPGCNEPAVRGRLNLCLKHRDENAQRKIDEYNRKVTLKRQEWRKSNPVLCREDGCSNPVEKPRELKCAACKAKALHKEKRVRAVRQPVIEPEVELAKLWIPRPKPAPIMTDAEQRRIDAELNARLNERCGYGRGTVKVYSKAEIAAMTGQITPISQAVSRACKREDNNEKWRLGRK